MIIKTKREFLGVPVGTTGKAELEKDGLFRITWDLTTSLTDWFSKSEFEEYLEVVE